MVLVRKVMSASALKKKLKFRMITSHVEATDWGQGWFPEPQAQCARFQLLLPVGKTWQVWGTFLAAGTLAELSPGQC